jgi:hypothetical protein
MQQIEWMSDWRHDLRCAVRQLKASPVLTAVLTITIALGIGATVAIFSVLHAVLLRPLPVADSDRIVLGTLKAGVTLDAAQADMERVTRGIAEREPRNMEGRSVNVQRCPDRPEIPLGEARGPVTARRSIRSHRDPAPWRSR